MSGLRVGVDAGGTHAEAVVVDPAGREVARARGPGAVLTQDEPERAVAAVADAVRSALASLGVREGGGPEGGAPPVVRALWAGMAGAGREAPRARAEALLSELALAHRVRVGTDADAAFASAFGDGPGILLIAGTGSVAYGRAPGGRRVRAGGWGARLGDEGSGYWIGMHALGCLARAEDGRAQPTALRNRVLGHLGLSDPYDLIGWVERASKAEVAALTPLVLEVAMAGDPVAASIVTDAAAALRMHLLALMERLDGEQDDVSDGEPVPPQQPEAPPIRLALWGGLIGARGPLRPVLERLIAPLGLPLVEGPLDPALGAAHLASRLG